MTLGAVEHEHTHQSRRRPTLKRSPSPIISFHPTPLSAESTKGVKNITRRVIKQLEGLGMVDANSLPEEGEEDDVDSGHDQDAAEVEHVLKSHAPNGHAHQPSLFTKIRNLWHYLEAPRKILHSSIGFVTLYLYVANTSVRIIVLVLWSALAIIIPADLLRLNFPAFEHVYERALGFLMRDSEKESVNGVIWYILGVNFALTFYPQDIATVAILILSWADTAASTIGRLYGARTPKLPARLPFLRIPLAPRKSLAGFLAASITGSAIAAGFWAYFAPFRNGNNLPSWSWSGGFNQNTISTGGPLGLLAIAVVAGVVSGVAEALDLGSLDDNLTLPIISGAVILGFFKLVGWLASTFSSS